METAWQMTQISFFITFVVGVFSLLLLVFEAVKLFDSNPQLARILVYFFGFGLSVLIILQTLFAMLSEHVSTF